MLGLPGLEGRPLCEVVELGRGRGASVPLLEVRHEIALCPGDHPVALRPPLQQGEVDADDLAHRALGIRARTVCEPHAEFVGEVLLQGGVVELRYRHVGLEHDAAVDGQPGAVVRGLHLVRDRDVGVQVGVAGARVAVGEGRGDDSERLDLPDARCVRGGCRSPAPRGSAGCRRRRGRGNVR